MKQQFEVEAVSREGAGRHDSRRLRASGFVPAIVYGASKEPEKVSIHGNALRRYLEQEAFYSHILNLKVGGKEQRVVLREVQRHPSRPQVLHLDLLRVAEDRKLHMEVPLHFAGEEQCIGVKQQGGVIAHLVTEVEIACFPKDLPEYLELDISTLELGASYHLSDIQLPENVQIPALERSEDLDIAVVSVFKPKAVEEVAPTEGEEEATEAAGATTEEGAPKEPDEKDKGKKDEPPAESS